MTRLRFNTLAIDLVPKRTREYIELKLQSLKTGQQARTLASNDKNKQWAYKVLDQLGRAGILSFNGIEVAIFCAREAIAYRQEEVDPIPEKQVHHTNDLWVRVEFFKEKAASKKNSYFADRELELINKVMELEGLLKQQRIELISIQNKYKIIPRFNFEDQLQREIKRTNVISFKDKVNELKSKRVGSKPKKKGRKNK